jgi:predicted nuclease of predicted toxin-antitoxin system
MQPEKLEFWIDVHLPPKMARWLIEDFQVSAKSFWELQFNKTDDIEVFKLAASNKNTIIITTKDIDFINLQKNKGTPPKILYLNVGNISNKQLRDVINKSFPKALQIFTTTNNQLVEITI